jgi:hypothetical protein
MTLFGDLIEEAVGEHFSIFINKEGYRENLLKLL